jgi:hypothetical protein
LDLKRKRGSYVESFHLLNLGIEYIIPAQKSAMRSHLTMGIWDMWHSYEPRKRRWMNR